MAEIDTHMGILDSRDLALLVWVTKTGDAQMQANGCNQAYAALVGEVVRRAAAPSDELAGALVDIVIEGVFARGYDLVGPSAGEESDRG